MFNTRIPVKVNGIDCTLAFDLAAAMALDLEFHIKLAELDHLQKRKDLTFGEELDWLRKLLYCMTRSSDAPPTMKDIERMSMEELTLLRGMVPSLIGRSIDSGLGKGRAETVPGAVSGSESPTSGTGSSSRRSTALVSRRKKS